MQSFGVVTKVAASFGTSLSVRSSRTEGSLRVFGSSRSHFSGRSAEDPRVDVENVPSFCLLFVLCLCVSRLLDC